MKLTKILICLLVFWTGTLSASPYFSFKKYQVEDGLSHNTVWCALQDSYGFIWLGTSDGLNRYDGRGNKVYRKVLIRKQFCRSLDRGGQESLGWNKLRTLYL